MGRRSRKRRGAPPAHPRQEAPPRPPGDADPGSPRDTLRRGYARSEERNEQIRQSLEPLAPGERPGAVTVAAIVALLLALANGVAITLGETVGGDRGRPAAVALSLVLLVAAWGMWRARYWAVLGFQALLTLQIIIAFLGLLVVGDVWRAIVLAAVVLLGGWLFWKLVRAMARLQMPVR